MIVFKPLGLALLFFFLPREMAYFAFTGVKFIKTFFASETFDEPQVDCNKINQWYIVAKAW